MCFNKRKDQFLINNKTRSKILVKRPFGSVVSPLFVSAGAQKHRNFNVVSFDNQYLLTLLK